MIDPFAFRQVLSCYPTGVCVVTSLTYATRPIGMSVGSFTSASLDPPLVAFLPSRASSTWLQIQGVGRFCINVLASHQEAISRRFASPVADKFAGVSHRTSNLGMPILDGVAAWIDCRVHAVHEAGDHHIVLGEVVSLSADPDVRPLVFHKGGYGQVNPSAIAA